MKNFIHPPYLSIVIPLLNEEEVVPELIKRLEAVLKTLPEICEVLVVDDGSTDSTADLILTALRDKPWLRLVQLSRRFGHQAALSAGIDHALGEKVVLMDGDLQDPPELIQELLRQHELGAEVVYVTRASRSESMPKSIAYRLFYRLLRGVSSVSIPLDSGDFCLIGPRALAALRSLPESVRFLRGMRAWCGFSQKAVAIDRSARVHGHTKYSVGRLVRLAVDGLFSFSLVPLRLATIAGLVSLLIAAVFVAYWLLLRILTGELPPGFAASMVVVLFTSGVQFLLLGIIGEYVGRIFEEVKRRPPYIVSRIVSGMGHESPSTGVSRGN